MYLRSLIICMWLLCVLVFIFCKRTFSLPQIEGRYTTNISSYYLVIPRKVNADGDFVTFKLPHFYKHNFSKRRKRESNNDAVNFILNFNGRSHHLKLYPNHGFISPNLIIERFSRNVVDRQLRSVNPKQCHYTGYINGMDHSFAAVSVCDGLVGHLFTDDGHYFIEPVKDQDANSQGHHLHVIYNGLNDDKDTSRCATNSDWKRSWAEQFRRQMLERNFSRRKTESQHRYAEVLIVADKKFLTYHKNENYESYILTLVNMASNYYHDSSIGNMIDIVLKRIIYLEREEEELDLEINPNSEKTLESFCKWQEKINLPEEDVNHYDVAWLITRHDLCSIDDGTPNCGLLGLAYLSGVCDKTKCCSINEDTGLLLGITLTHEMGHLLGASHDAPDESECTAQTRDGNFHVMAPAVNVATVRWSTCSKGFVTALFDFDLGECLNNEPTVAKYKIPDVLPGVMYDASFQCKSMSTSMPFGCSQLMTCAKLACKQSSEAKSCSVYSSPPFDGTSCGENKWCYKKECVVIGERPAAINGGWGQWSSWSECSRTCGGGVSEQSRDCDNPKPENKGHYCTGERKRFSMCNTNECPFGSKPFRAVQCEAQNKPGETYTPYNPRNENAPCKLFCLQQESGMYHSFKTQDGTPCKPGTKDVCFKGHCKRIGCDWKFNSEAVEDICGVCQGDGTNCKLHSSTYSKVPRRLGRQEVVVIPSGAKRIHIEELSISTNIIIIADANKKYLLNSESLEEQDKEFILAGADTVYIHPADNQEDLYIHDPINEPITFYVMFFIIENVGYKYSYITMNAPTAYQPSYQWEHLDWKECNVRCGGGTEISEPSCVEKRAGKVDTKYCDQKTKPEPMSRSCNAVPCLTKWRTGVWSRCNGCRFHIGFRKRAVECVRDSQTNLGDDVVLEWSQCNIENRPTIGQLCISNRPCSKTVSRKSVVISPEDTNNLWHQVRYPELSRRSQTYPYSNSEFMEEQAVTRKRKNIDQAKQCQNQVMKNFGHIVKDYHFTKDDKPDITKISIKKLPLSDSAFEKLGDILPIGNQIGDKKPYPES